MAGEMNRTNRTPPDKHKMSGLTQSRTDGGTLYKSAQLSGMSGVAKPEAKSLLAGKPLGRPRRRLTNLPSFLKKSSSLAKPLPLMALCTRKSLIYK